MSIMDGTNDTSAGSVLLPVAGGKGGVGKSVVAANLALSLANMGFKTIAADMDLGGSNLYSFLGLGNTYRGIGDFVRQDDAALEEFLVPGPVKGLSYLPGDGTSPFLANITYHQKKRLLTGLSALNADFTIIDLGAGTSFNVLDFYALTNRGLLVTTPDFPAILSMLAFLKNLLFRRMDEAVKANRKVRSALTELFHGSSPGTPLTTANVLEQIGRMEPALAKQLGEIQAAIRPMVIFNLGEKPDDLNLIKQFQRGLRKVLSLEADYLGFIFRDAMAAQSVRQRKPLMISYPDSISAKEIKQIARRILKFKDQPVPNSAELLMESTRRFYERNGQSPET